jgi:glyoxylase I family protein
VTDVIGIDHIYISVSELSRSEAFYDRVLCDALGFRKNAFTLGGEPHLQYANRLFGFVLRPARVRAAHEPYAPGLHHFCLRVDSAADVHDVARRLQQAGIAASPARVWPEYAEDYCATFFEDPDGLRLEVTNWRRERRERAAHWDDPAS